MLERPFKEKRKRKLMLELSNIDELSPAQLRDMIQQLEQKLDAVQTYALDILIRSPEEIELCAIEEIKKLSAITNKINLVNYVNTTYNYSFFAREPDTDYKIYLCIQLVDYMKTVVPNFSNSLIEGIAEGSNKYYEYIKNSIIEV